MRCYRCNAWPCTCADGITLIHGDCREVMPGIGRFDAVVTDPPYGIGFAAQPTKWQRLAGQVAERWDDAAPCIDGVLQVAPVACVWGGNYFALPPSRGWLVWTKPDAPPSMGSVEMAWTNIDQNSRFISHAIGATNAERVGHPTQKPLRVMLWCIGMLPNPRTILDPFCGSGTTLVAAKQLGRRATGIELEERYCDLAANRLRQEVFAFEGTA